MSHTPLTDVEEDDNNHSFLKSPPAFKIHFQQQMMNKSAEKEAKSELLSYQNLTSFIRLVIFSYMTTSEIINKVSFLNKSTRNLILNKGGASSKKFNFPERQIKFVLKENK